LVFRLNDIAEIAEKLTACGSGLQRNLILIAGLPGTGKTTIAKEFVRQMRAISFDIDDVKRRVVPKDAVTEEIDPPEYRYKYYAETIRKLPELFAGSQNNTVIIDETFHLKDFREMWEEAARELNIRVLWIEVVCEEEAVKERLCVGKDRECHILGDKAYPMYCLFKDAFDPMNEPREVVDTCKDIVPQIQRIIEKLSLRWD
jgi:predicted kinase